MVIFEFELVVVMWVARYERERGCCGGGNETTGIHSPGKRTAADPENDEADDALYDAIEALVVDAGLENHKDAWHSL